MPTGRLSGNITQDWEPVVLRRTKPKAADLKSTKAVNQALRSGAPVDGAQGGGGDEQEFLSRGGAHAQDGRDDRAGGAGARGRGGARGDPEGPRGERVELVKCINERAQVVQEYESGKAVPVQSVLGRMERALEVKLCGKAVGAPRPPAPSDDAREC